MRFAIVGVGKIGSWLAKTLAEQHAVAVYDCDVERCHAIGNIVTVTSLEQLLETAPDCIICATPLHTTKHVLSELDEISPKDIAFADVASLKEQISDFYTISGRRFISLHPMFGPTFADMTSLSGEDAIIIEESDSELAVFFSEFFRRQSIRTRLLSFKDHDRLMMSSLLAPYLSSLLLVELLEDVDAPGTTLARQRAIAKGVFCHPTEFISEVLSSRGSSEFLAKATSIIAALQQRNPRELSKQLARARDKLGTPDR